MCRKEPQAELIPGALHTVSQADHFQKTDEVPSDVRLIPAEAKARRSCVRVMIPVPVFTPGGQLKRPKPPDVLTGITLAVVVQVGQTIDEALHVQRINQADCT